MMIALLMSACSGEEETPELPTRVPVVATATETPTTIPTDPPPTQTPAPTAIPVETTADNPALQSYVQMLHAVPGGPSVDVYFESLGLAFALNYGNPINETPITGGTYNVTVMSSGERLNSDVAPVATGSITIPDATTVSLIIAAVDGAVQLNTYTVDTSPIAGEQARISLINYATPDVILTRDNNTLIAPVPSGAQSPYITVDASGGSITISDGTEPLAFYARTPRSKNSITLVLIPAADEGFEVVSFENRVEAITRLQIINASFVVASVDVYANGAPLISAVESTRTTGRNQIPSGTYRIDFLPAGQDYATTPPLASTEFNANDDEDITLVFAGEEGNFDIIRLREDLTPTASNEARMTFINVLPSVPVASLQTNAIEDDNPLRDLRYTEASNPRSLDAGIQDFSWNNADSFDEVEAANDVELIAGFNYLYILTGQTENPLIFGDSVGIDESLQPDRPVEPTSIPQRPVSLRVVNMLSSREPVAVFLEEAPLLSPANHATASVEILTGAGTYTIGVYPPNTTEPVAEFAFVNLTLDFAPGDAYSLYIIGENSTSAEIRVLQNVNLNGQAAVRFGNLTQGRDTSFGLALQDAALEISQPTPDPTAIVDLDPNRLLIYGPAETLFFDVGNSTFSNAQRYPAGAYNIIIIDVDNTSAAKYEYNVNFAADTQYDIIVEEIAGNAVNIFVVTYP